MLTLQQYYDLLVKSAFDGTFPSIDPVSKLCKYKLGNKKCAVGVVLPDDALDNILFNCSSDLLLERFPELKKLVPTEVLVESEDHYSRPYLRVIQLTHDRRASINEWKPNEFIKELNTINCFDGVVKYEPSLVT